MSSAVGSQPAPLPNNCRGAILLGWAAPEAAGEGTARGEDVDGGGAEEEEVKEDGMEGEEAGGAGEAEVAEAEEEEEATTATSKSEMGRWPAFVR